MCDEAKLKQWALDRRQFGALAGAAVVTACAPGETGGNDGAGNDSIGLTERAVTFDTDDGTMDAFFVHPSEGQHPAVIFWPDIASIREAKRNMARRLAGEGYAVLVLNPYYRDVAGEQFADFAAWAGNDGFATGRNSGRPWQFDIARPDPAVPQHYLGKVRRLWLAASEKGQGERE